MSLTGGKLITIKEVIQYCANVGGGIHQRNPRDKNNAKTIHATANSILINNVPYPIGYLRNIVNICIMAILPVYERVRI